MKKIVLAGALVIVLIVTGILVGFTTGNRAPETASVRVTTLKPGDLASTVSATGTIYSQSSTNVYSNVNYPVKAVSVAVGDIVEEGDVLAELDMSALELDIAQKQAALSSSQLSAQYSLATAQNDLDTLLFNTENNYDTSLLSAEAAVKSAELEVSSATRDLTAARKEYREARDAGEDDDALEKLRETVTAKEFALEKSNLALEKAQDSLKAAKIKNQEDAVALQSKVKSAEIKTDLTDQSIAIKKLQGDLAKGVVTAPVSGTVTAVNAITGGAGNGILFVIQDAENLKVVTNIKEYDIADVSVGDEVTIKTDATGDREFSGTLNKIAPTSTLTSKGDAATSTDAVFETEVSVDTDSDGLRIGMNARMEIITEQHKNVYSVPFEAVVARGDGSIVYLAKQQPDGTYTAEAVPVTTGLETDLYIEISGDQLADGAMVISSADGITPGMTVNLSAGGGGVSAEGTAAGGGPGGGGRPNVVIAGGRVGG